MKPPRTRSISPTANERRPDRPTEAPADSARPGANAAVEFIVPIKTKSTLNLREHWAARAKRVKRERNATSMVMNQLRTMPLALAFAPAIRIDMTRISPRGLDSDNLAGSLKGIRDQVAKELGCDDGDDCLEWVYSQEKGKPAVRVRIQALGAIGVGR